MTDFKYINLINQLRQLAPEASNLLDQRTVSKLKQQVNQEIMYGNTNAYGKMVLKELARERGIK